MTTKISSSNIRQTTLDNIGGGGGGPKITGIEVTNSSYTVIDDTAVSLTGGYIKITGTGFTTGCRVLINNTPATSVTFVDSTTVRAQVGAKTAGTYLVYLVNTDGGVAIAVDGLTYSDTPTWSTSSTLPSQRADIAISIQLSAASAQTYTLAAGSTLPTGLALSSGGLLNGTVAIQADTTYSFTINAIDAENQDSPRTFSLTVNVAVLDPYFSSTSLMIRGTGSNNSTNSTFLDSSTNNSTITRNGDTTQGSFSPFSPAGWSTYFDGSGDYLTLPSTTAVNLTGDFTFEAWVCPEALLGNAFGVFDARASGGTSNAWLVNLKNSSGYKNTFFEGTERMGTTTIPLNTWTHIAWTRSGSALSGFVNGVRDYYNASYGTGAISPTSTSSPRIGTKDNGVGGYETHGYISNLRLINGTALYTSNFTPSTTPLTAVTNTVLLTCQSNRFIDKSTNNFTITRSGDTSIQPFSPFSPPAEYNANTVGGSAYFDGSGDYLSIPTNSAFDFGTGDFTVETWLWLNSGASSGAFLSGASVNSTDLVYFENSLRFGRNNTAWDNNFSYTFAPNQWYHVAFVRASGVAAAYVNGVQIGSAANTNDYGSVSGNIYIGASRDLSRGISGYISNYRIVKGTAVYTANFTPPIAPLTAISNTSLLLNFGNHSITDATSNHVIQTVDGAKISTTQTKFSGAGGGSSMYFDGAGDYLKIPSTPILNIGSANFTIEMWAYKTASDNNFTLFRKGLSTTVIYELKTDSDRWVWQTGGSNIFVTSGGLTQNSWVHVALVRNGTTTTLYLNGNAAASGTSVNSSENTDPLQIGFGDRTFTGYLSNFRISKGLARYTANFTPPTEPFPIQ